MLSEIINDNFELEGYKRIKTNGSITTETTVKPGEEYFHIIEIIYKGKNEIYTNEFTVDRELLRELNNL